VAVDGVTHWLRHKRRKALVFSVIYFLCAFIGGAAMFALTCCGVYVTVFLLTAMLSGGRYPSERWSLAVTVALAALG